jgi:hypothetical protein
MKKQLIYKKDLIKGILLQDILKNCLENPDNIYEPRWKVAIK